MTRPRRPAGAEHAGHPDLFSGPPPAELPPSVVQVPGASPETAIAVSTLTRTARAVVEGAFAPLWIRGEVSDFKAHRNGHWYFCLRDERAQMRCVIWSRDQHRIPASPDDGMQVFAFGQLTVYPTRGAMQFTITALEGVGEGLWRKALEQTRARLEADGLLRPERKRPLVRFPRRVAVVTSPDGAALHDIISVIRRRCPVVEIVVVPARVQGEGAAEQIVAAIERVSRWKGAETVIVGRGGGAREDLWAFNDERVARAMAACSVPVISAVGHEVDVSLCDLVADLRAATPSAAAEAAVPVLSEEHEYVRALHGAMQSVLQRRARRAREAMGRTARTLRTAGIRVAERRLARLERAAGRLHALSPLATLARGYAVARDSGGHVLASVAEFAPGAPFTLTVRDGRIGARTTATIAHAAGGDQGLPQE